ncbi:hypothetical protein [Faecalispora jeddahensis]|uniref:hypothetical protein n=1 Tax=Faecalispora jeddahensis TaxID=1414721 RepID=UPI0018975ACA|nr:hypothetical protein [Faecalispora jeddahensis]
MDQIKFADGTILNAIVINAQTVNFQGSARAAIEVELEKDTITFDALYALLKDINKTKNILLISGENQNPKDNFIHLADGPRIRQIYIQRTDGTEGTTEERMCFTLAQKNYTEVQIDSLQDQVDLIVLSILNGGI